MALLLLAALLAGHPGHGSMALVGTLVAVRAEAITIDVRDVASTATRRLVVTTTSDTRLRVGKETVPALDRWIGAPVVVTVDYEEGVDGRTIYTADKVQITPLKAKKR
jgi:hypothetical protein